jgi:signal transduction histidine kinase
MRYLTDGVMDRKERSYYLQNFVYGRSEKGFEERLLILSTLFMSLFNLVYAFANLFMGLGLWAVVATIFGFVVFFILYLNFRFKSRPKIMYFITALLMLFYIDIGWLLNYGSNGPVFQFFIVLLAFIVLLFQRKYYLNYTMILIANAIVLFSIEYFQEGFVGTYPSNQSRLFDNYFGFFICIPIVLSFLSTIKQNYIYESERAKKSDQLKSAFLANMSHEIRTPLNAIVGFSSLMTDPYIADAEKKLYGEQVVNNSDYLLNLIEDIVDVSKIESNQLNIKKNTVDVIPVIDKTIQSFQLSVLSQKNIIIKNKLDLPKLTLRVDQVRFEQILRNLISNAVKFTVDGVIEVDCSLDHDYYVFSVKDFGIGIEPKYHDVIFDRFMKIENNKDQLYRGTGLGLFISKQLVEMFGGEIWVESEIGKGSTFYFTIPA